MSDEADSDGKIPDMRDVPEMKTDVPRTDLAIRDKDEARALARRMGGDQPPDRCWFHCVQCGWNATMHFDKDEMEALGGDVTGYGGPCPENQPSLGTTDKMGCGAMTLVPRNSMLGDDFRSIQDRASENRKQEFGEAADVFIDKVQGRLGDVMVNAMTGATGATPPAEADASKADDMNVEGMEPRKG